MSQSPLQRTSRRSLPAFVHVPSRLSRPSQHSGQGQGQAQGQETIPESPSDARSGAPSPSPSTPTPAGAAESSRTPARARYTSTGTSTLTPTPGAGAGAGAGASAGASAGSSPFPRSRTHNDLSTPVRPRGSGSGTGSGGARPQTPIHYSPFALATPPPSLSKSASVPFDMAASARAARVASERKARGLEREDTDDGDGAAVELPVDSKAKRFIRRKSWYKRALDYPADLLDTILLAMPTTIDELLPAENLAHPIALGVHSVHFLCVAPLWSRREDHASVLRARPDRSVGGRWERWEDEQRYGASGWGLILFTLILTLLAVINAAYLFSRFRTYDMQLRTASDPPISPHASPIAKPRPSSSAGSGTNSDAGDPFIAPESREKEELLRRVLRVTWRVLVFTIKGTYAAIKSMLGRPSTSHRSAAYDAQDQIQSLRVWDPPDFCLAFFCAYPPSSPVLAYLLTSAHPLLTPVLHLVSAGLLTQLSNNFRQLVKDRLLLSAEVMREYDRRFVYRRIFGGKADRGVQTNQAEMVW